MLNHQNQTAILFFSRTPAEEARAKRLGSKAAKHNVRIHRELYNRTVSTLQQTGLPVVHLSESEQSGKTFAERLTNAIAHVFDGGYDHVIAVGSDCPQLESVHWPAVVTQLQNGHAVLGPTNRNGAYLIGLSRSVFQKHEFANLPWQKAELLDALQRYLCQRCESVHYLARHIDINHTGDLYSFAEQQLSGSLKQLAVLLQQILYRCKYFSLSYKLHHQAQLNPSGLRAPPRPAA